MVPWSEPWVLLVYAHKRQFSLVTMAHPRAVVPEVVHSLFPLPCSVYTGLPSFRLSHFLFLILPPPFPFVYNSPIQFTLNDLSVPSSPAVGTIGTDTAPVFEFT